MPAGNSWPWAALIPALKVKADSVYNEQRQVLATKINFKGDDLKDAQKIQAGMHETKTTCALANQPLIVNRSPRRIIRVTPSRIASLQHTGWRLSVLHRTVNSGGTIVKPMLD